MFLLFSWATWILLSFVVLALYLIWMDSKSKNSDGKKIPPGPKSWPIIGSVLFMAKYTNILDAFEALGKQYGDVVSLKLGSIDSFVISGYENIKKVLCSDQFDSRPGFERFQMLFEGNRNNSLAFCDNSANQKKRRQIVSHHAFAKKGSNLFGKFDAMASDKIDNMVNKLKLITDANNQDNSPVNIETLLQSACLETFFQFFCSLNIDSSNEADYNDVRTAFDEIFDEVNDQCVGDLFPALMRFCNKSHLHEFGKPIRKFMMKYCVEPRLQQKAESNNNISKDSDKPTDLLDEFLNNVDKTEDLTLDNALFALEDMLGGSSAISGLLLQAFALLAKNPHVQTRLREEVEQATNGEEISLEKHRLAYAEAIIWEVSRKIGSPLVPHVANQDTSFGEYTVKKGTMLFFNNGELNSSPKYWTNPESFDPSRFLQEDGSFHKPEFFIPFGTGRRSCLGFRLVINLGMLLLSKVCQSYQIGTVDGEEYKVTLGSLAVPGAGFPFTLTPIN